MSTTKPAIPDKALDDRLGFLGMTGSGKTWGAGTCVERILARGGRVIVPDALGVWWGLRLLADGKTASPYEVVIFGGPHADMPITPHAGALIGETVAGMRESAIIDLSQFETAASERRFMLAFLQALYRKTSGEPVHIIFDEADLWAPQRIMDKEGDATKLHSTMQTVVRRGRVKGLTSWLISQRPAELSKSVLSQVDGLVAFRLTASQDRQAIGLWIEGQADREAGKAILSRLPEKKQGEAVVWLPQRGILADVSFPAKDTYNSSRAPKRGEKRRAVELRPVDLGALKEKLATVEAEVKANDPKALKAKVAELTRELQRKNAEKIPQNIPDAEAIQEAERRGLVAGHFNGFAEALKLYDKLLTDTWHELQKRVAAILAVREAAAKRVTELSHARDAVPLGKHPKVIKQPILARAGTASPCPLQSQRRHPGLPPLSYPARSASSCRRSPGGRRWATTACRACRRQAFVAGASPPGT